MKGLIDFNGRFSIKFDDVHTDDFEKVLRYFDDSDYGILNAEEFTFEYFGDDVEFINSYAGYLNNPRARNDFFFFTDNAARHIVESADVIDNEYKRVVVLIGAARQLNDAELLEASLKRQAELIKAAQLDLAKEIKARKHTVRLPNVGCLDDCYCLFIRHDCPGSAGIDFSTYTKENCPVLSEISKYRKDEISFEIKKAQ